jgi:hypothetical protein
MDFLFVHIFLKKKRARNCYSIDNELSQIGFGWDHHYFILFFIRPDPTCLVLDQNFFDRPNPNGSRVNSTQHV